MGNRRGFDAEAALRGHFRRQEKAEAALMRGSPLPWLEREREPGEKQGIQRGLGRGGFFAEVVTGLGLAACLALALSLPLRSPLLDLGMKAVRVSAGNGTFRTLSRNAISITLHVGRAFSR